VNRGKTGEKKKKKKKKKGEPTKLTNELTIRDRKEEERKERRGADIFPQRDQ